MRHYDRLLFSAAKDDDPDEIKFAILHGANPYAQCIRGNTPAHYAAKYGSANALKELLKHLTGIALILNDRHETPLHTAAYYGAYECAQIIMDADSRAIIRCFEIKSVRNKMPLDMCYDVLTHNLIRNKMFGYYAATR